jgi:hypothetical protein
MTARRLDKRANLASIHDGSRTLDGVSPEDLEALEAALLGRLVLPGDTGYPDATRQANPLFTRKPFAIAFCEHETDVRTCILWARRLGLTLTARSGGHSTAGYSVADGTLTVDLSGLDCVAVDPERMVARVGPGTDFGRLNHILDQHGLHVPGGACEQVCVAGFSQGGGFGFTSRAFGMNCDNVREVVLLDCEGRRLRANARENADLFWAVRGGTGGNFGVVVEIAYQLHPLASAWGFKLRWDLDHAPAAMAMMQAQYMRGGAPASIGYMTFVIGTKGPPALYMRGMCTSGRDTGLAALAPLQATPGAMLEDEKTAPYGVLNIWLTDDLAPKNLAVARELKVSNYIDRPLGEAGWQRVLEPFRALPGFPAASANTLTLEPYGGVIASGGAQAHNAFIHRGVDMDFAIDSFYGNLGEAPAAAAWMQIYTDFLRTGPSPVGNGHVYQNYPEAGLDDYASAYFGSAYQRLREIKTRYDPPQLPHYPSGFFHFPQSVTPLTDSSEGA